MFHLFLTPTCFILYCFYYCLNYCLNFQDIFILSLNCLHEILISAFKTISRFQHLQASSFQVPSMTDYLLHLLHTKAYLLIKYRQVLQVLS